MEKRIRAAALAVVGIGVLAAAQLGTARAASPTTGCTLGNAAGAIQHVVVLQLEALPFRRDRAGIPSDLEQVPNLYNFLRTSGTLFTNDHSVLLANTTGGTISTLTGLYPDRTGTTVSDDYGWFAPGGAPATTGSAAYWTAPVDPATDPLPALVTNGGRNVPAPWVPFTRAGCDVGSVGVADVALENASDVGRVFGTGSPEWAEALADPARAQGDFVGIAVHCSQAATSRCTGAVGARPDALPDEPGGYDGYRALFGARAVDPAIAGGNACVADTTGQAIRDARGTCGFPGFGSLDAKATLGYVAQMLEAGVPVVFGTVAGAGSYGPGERGLLDRLHADDAAFGAFFQQLAAHGIDASNTLFVVTSIQGRHFAGGVGAAQPDGSLAYGHGTCTDLSACAGNQLGAIVSSLPALLPAGSPSFALHAGSAAALYVAGQPGRTDPAVRQLARDLGGLTSLDPYARDASGAPKTVDLVQWLADPIEESALHLLAVDPARTPTLAVFANPDFTLQAGGCGVQAQCADAGDAWSVGGAQNEVATTWLGLVGPGVKLGGIDTHTWTDHANVRPTLLALLGLRDDYVHDGRVLVEALDPKAIPRGLAPQLSLARQLGAAYEQLNAPFGSFGMSTLSASTTALASGSAADDSTYTATEALLAKLTRQRNALAGDIKTALDGAAFAGIALDAAQVRGWTGQAYALIAHAMAVDVLHLTHLP